MSFVRALPVTEDQESPEPFDASIPISLTKDVSFIFKEMLVDSLPKGHDSMLVKK